MSKTRPSFLPIFAASLLILHLFNNSNAQDIEATIKIDPKTPHLAYVQGRFLTKQPLTNSISFLVDDVGRIGLKQRISNVRVGEDLAGVTIPGNWNEYLAVVVFKRWSYTVNLRHQIDSSHMSTMDDEGYVLMLDDLLPQKVGKSAKIKIEVPTGWKLFSAAKTTGNNEFEIPNIEKSAFFVSRNWREKDLPIVGSSVKLLLSGEWLFTDDEAAKHAAEVFAFYQKVFGAPPAQKAQIIIRRFPLGTLPGRWDADTRGSSIVIVSSDTAFKSESIQVLHEQLRHEIFHLWIPSNLNLTGNYDWFYEGFALYESLKIALAVNRIRFEDMLDTLSRAYNLESGMMMTNEPQSLIELSKLRWVGVSNSNSRIYSRGMLVAFMCDLALLEKSKGKRSVPDVLRQLYERHRPPAVETDGNAAVLKLLRSYSELVPIIDRNITGSESIEWNDQLKVAGLEAEQKGQTTKLKVTAKPSGRQKDLLDKLGYNNWRKLATK